MLSSYFRWLQPSITASLQLSKKKEKSVNLNLHGCHGKVFLLVRDLNSYMTKDFGFSVDIIHRTFCGRSDLQVQQLRIPEWQT